MTSIETALKRLKERGVQPSSRPAVDPSLAPRLSAGTASSRLSTVEVGHNVRLAALGEDAAAYLTAGNKPEFAEQLRQIRWPLVAKAFGRGVETVDLGNVVVVTSSVAGEGKTFCSLNLAVSMAAERDFDVLLIDADLTNPKLSTLLRLERRPGFADLIRNGTEGAVQAISGTDVPGLFVMGAGLRDGREAELVAGGRVHEIVAYLASSYRDLFVLFDSPPLHETSGARALVGMAGQVVLVVQAGVTPRKKVMESLSLLEGVEPVSLILNQVTSKQPPAYGSAYKSPAQAAPPRPQLEARSNDNDLL